MKENFTSFFSDIALQNSFLLIMSTSEKVLKFTASVRGFHYYQRIWSPMEGEKLNCFHRRDNAFDVFAIKTRVRKWIYCRTFTERDISNYQVYIRSWCKINRNSFIYKLSSFTPFTKRFGNCLRDYCENAISDKKPHDFGSIQRVNK